MPSLDQQIRLAAFNWLRQQIDIYGDVLSRELLLQGFIFENERIPLVSPQGIFKPKQMDYPLSITTSPISRYDDSSSDDGFLTYKYRGTDIYHRDNEGLRECMKRNLPLIYLLGTVPSKYLVIWPVFIISDNPSSLSFKIALNDIETIERKNGLAYEPEGKKMYSTSTIRLRLYQRCFREKVLYAYRSQCSLCKLRHQELLDAAHIIPYGELNSRLTVDNGISLCKLHHAAFDSFIIGVNPDYKIEVRKDILNEIDGPMLQHGLKELHGNKIILPKHKIDFPNKELLDIRYQRFRNAS